MPVTFMSPLASLLSLMSSSGNQSPHCQEELVLIGGKHAPLWVPSPTLWSVARESTPCKRELFSRGTSDPHSNCLACASGFQRNGEKPLFLHAATLCCSLRKLGSEGLLGKLAAVLELSLCLDAGSGLCLPLGHLLFIRDFWLHYSVPLILLSRHAFWVY